MTNERSYWFGRKRFGWGVGPRSWQGWVVIVIYCALMISSVRMIDPAFHPVLGVAVKVVLTIAFFVVLMAKLDRSKPMV